MRGSGKRFVQDCTHIKDSFFVALCKLVSPRHFSRARKLTLNHLILAIIDRKGVALSMEIRRFFRFLRAGDGNIGTEGISVAGYLKQRLKLNPAAFQALSDFHVKNFYDDEKEGLAKIKGHLVFAVDGSHLNVPNTPEAFEQYGGQVNQFGQQAQVGISCLYDVLNKMVLDCTVNHCKFDERAQAEAHFEKIPTIIGDERFIIVLDRGYPSSFLFMNRLEQDHKFVVRLSSSDFRKEQMDMKDDDEDVEVVFTKQRINPYRRTPLAKRLQEKGSIHLRFVKVLLPGGVIEVLATNLSRDEFTPQDVSNIYRLRWGIETAYDALKNKFMLENFTGKKAIIVEQDILSTVYLYNIVQDMLRDAEMEQKQKNAHKKHKYTMTINRNAAIGIVKEDLIRMALQDDPEEREVIFNSIIAAMANNIVPIRENRQFQRKKKNPSIKHPSTRKRSY